MRADEIRAERGVVRGTAHFMSPEQAAGAPDVDGRSDLYSLGVLGYALLSGTLPFEGGNFVEVLAQHASAPPVPLSERAPDVPAGVARVVMRCLAKAPDDRWPSGRALREALLRECLEAGAARTRPLARAAGRLRRLFDRR
jgi:serine/threonine-protein kinase